MIGSIHRITFHGLTKSISKKKTEEKLTNTHPNTHWIKITTKEVENVFYFYSLRNTHVSKQEKNYFF